MSFYRFMVRQIYAKDNKESNNIVSLTINRFHTIRKDRLYNIS